jgi:tetratricopeptide (TPR) repeat protein
MREAARLDQEGKCAEAEPIYRQALTRGPASAALLNNAGNHYLLCKQPQRARLLWEQLVKLVPAHVNANLQLATLAIEAKQRQKAIGHLDAIVKAADPAVQFAVGVAFARLELFDRAEAILHGVLQKTPTDFDALYQYGRAAARAKHYDRAREALESAVRLRPSDVDALVELGLAAAASNDSARAVFVLAKAEEKAPARLDIALALARAAEDAGFYGDAALAYDRYLTLKPGDAIARRDRARVLAATGSRVEEGLKEMAAYIAKYPKDAVGHYNLAQFTWRSTPEKSLEQLATAIRLDPAFAPAHVSRAWLLHRLGRSSEAVPYLQAALRITPGNVRALDQLGLVYLTLDRAADAEKALRKATALDPADLDVRLHLGRALMALGRDQEAQPLLESYQQASRKRQRNPRLEPGMIESAKLPDDVRRRREIERLEKLSKARPDDEVLQLNLARELVRERRDSEALDLTLRAVSSSPDDADLQLMHAAVLGLLGRTAEAGKNLNTIKTRWPDWGRPYVIHGLLLIDDRRESEGKQMIRTAVALGSPTCGAGLREYIAGSCDQQQ